MFAVPPSATTSACGSESQAARSSSPSPQLDAVRTIETPGVEQDRLRGLDDGGAVRKRQPLGDARTAERVWTSTPFAARPGAGQSSPRHRRRPVARRTRHRPRGSLRPTRPPPRARRGTPLRLNGAASARRLLLRHDVQPPLLLLLGHPLQRRKREPLAREEDQADADAHPTSRSSAGRSRTRTRSCTGRRTRRAARRPRPGAGRSSPARAGRSSRRSQQEHEPGGRQRRVDPERASRPRRRATGGTSRRTGGRSRARRRAKRGTSSPTRAIARCRRRRVAPRRQACGAVT